ncbi:MAG: DUF4912 domain-containing protein [Minicystis sp.]
MQRQDLERMSREQLIAHAERLGIPRPRVLTQPELIDEIIGRTAKNDRERVKARGWLGRARDLLANVVEKGLHLPEAARVLRQEEKGWPAPPPPLPTVTLAEIYAAQGHFERAIAVLDEVLAREPDHREAKSLRERFVEQHQRSRSRAGRIEAPPPPTAKEAPAKAAKQAKDAGEKKEAAEKREEAPPSPRVRTAAVRAAAAASVESAPAEVSKPAAGAHGSESGAQTIPTGAQTIQPGAQTIQPGAQTIQPGAQTIPAEAHGSEAEAEGVLEAAEAVSVLEPLDEPPLPQRYEVDEVVAIAVDPRTIYIYWEVRPTTLAHARAQHPDGALALRIASVTASWEGPVVDKRDLHVDALYGDRFIRDVQPGSNVRVSVGWKSAAGFEPLAVGTEVTAPRAVPVESVAQDVARWAEEPVAPFAAWRPETAPPQAPRAGQPEPFVPRPAMPVPWARAIAGAPPAQSAPVDTGVASWGEPGAEPREEIVEGEQIVEQSWFIAGGASELSRGGPGRVRTVSRRLILGAPLGGASDLLYGGASELGHN